MSDWIRVLNSLPTHPKVVRAGDRAAWLYVCGLCYANEHLTDGFIPADVLVIAAPGVKGAEKLADRLSEVGLWHAVDGGWQVHDYADHQRTSEQIRSTRQKDRARKARKDSTDTFRVESARNPDGIRGDSNGGRERIPSDTYADARSQEKRREELETPHSPPGGEVVKFDRKPVPPDRLELAEAVLAEFNQQASTSYGAYTGQGKPTEDLKRIIGALTDAAEPLDLGEATRVIRWRLARPYWEGKPHTGVVFGPNVFPANRESARPGAQQSVSSAELGERLRGGAA